MTRVEQTATAFLVTSLGAAQKHTLQLFNSIEKGRFRVALAYLKRACAPQDHAGLRFTGVVRRFPPSVGFPRPESVVQWLRSFDPEVLVCVNSHPLFYSHLARMLARVRIPIIEIFHARNWRPVGTGRCS
jgi:hypothetical protein